MDASTRHLRRKIEEWLRKVATPEQILRIAENLKLTGGSEMVVAQRHAQVNQLMFVIRGTGERLKGVDGLTIWSSYEDAENIFKNLEARGFQVDRTLPPKLD